MEPLIYFAAADNQSGSSCIPANRITLIEHKPKPALKNIYRMSASMHKFMLKAPQWYYKALRGQTKQQQQHMIRFILLKRQQFSEGRQFAS